LARSSRATYRRSSAWGIFTSASSPSSVLCERSHKSTPTYGSSGSTGGGGGLPRAPLPGRSTVFGSRQQRHCDGKGHPACSPHPRRAGEAFFMKMCLRWVYYNQYLLCETLRSSGVKKRGEVGYRHKRKRNTPCRRRRRLPSLPLTPPSSPCAGQRRAAGRTASLSPRPFAPSRRSPRPPTVPPPPRPSAEGRAGGTRGRRSSHPSPTPAPLRPTQAGVGGRARRPLLPPPGPPTRRRGLPRPPAAPLPAHSAGAGRTGALPRPRQRSGPQRRRPMPCDRRPPGCTLRAAQRCCPLPPPPPTPRHAASGRNLRPHSPSPLAHFRPIRVPRRGGGTRRPPAPPCPPLPRRRRRQPSCREARAAATGGRGGGPPRRRRRRLPPHRRR